MVYSCKRRMNEVDGWNLQDHLTSIHLLVGYVIIDLDLHNLFEHTHLYQRKYATSQFLNVIAASYVIKQESHSPPLPILKRVHNTLLMYHPFKLTWHNSHTVQDMVEYKSKIRLLKVYTMDGAVKTVQV